MLGQTWHSLRRIQLHFPTKIYSGKPPNVAKRYNSSTPRNSPQKFTESPQTTPVRKSSSPDEVPLETVIWHQRLGPISRFITWFDQTQGRRPLSTQLCTSLGVYLMGDLLAQRLGEEPYNPVRTARHLIVGAIASIPGYRWFMFLGSRFNYPSRSFSILVKVVVQQIVFTPIFNTYFFCAQSLLSGAGIRGAAERIQRAVPESIVNSIKIWPAVTALNFTFILPQYRFLFAGAVACLWQSYLSWLNQREARLSRLQNNKQIAAREAA